MPMAPHDGCCWITGASSGLGRALALEMARQGWHVAASARGREGLDSLVAEAQGLPGEISAWPLDICDGNAVTQVVAQIDRIAGPIAMAVLNAGTHEAVPALPFQSGPYRHLIDINVMGTVHCLEAVLPLYERAGAGQVALVASQAGYFGLPTAAAYGLTKAGMIAMAQSLQPELAAAGIQIQVVNPGFVRTPLTDRNEFPMPFLMEPEAAARRFYRGLMSHRFEIVFPWRLALILKTLRLLPVSWALRLTRHLVPRQEDLGHDPARRV